MDVQHTVTYQPVRELLPFSTIIWGNWVMACCTDSCLSVIRFSIFRKKRSLACNTAVWLSLTPNPVLGVDFKTSFFLIEALRCLNKYSLLFRSQYKKPTLVLIVETCVDCWNIQKLHKLQVRILTKGATFYSIRRLSMCNFWMDQFSLCVSTPTYVLLYSVQSISATGRAVLVVLPKGNVADSELRCTPVW